jgi:hypothetical protein
LAIAKPFRIYCNMVPISMNYFVARGAGHQTRVASNAAPTFSLIISRASSIAAPSPAINFIVRITITLLDSTASNIKGMNIEYLQGASAFRKQPSKRLEEFPSR